MMSSKVCGHLLQKIEESKAEAKLNFSTLFQLRDGNEGNPGMSKQKYVPDTWAWNGFLLSTSPDAVLSILNKWVWANKKRENREQETGHLKWAEWLEAHAVGIAQQRAQVAGASLSEQLHIVEKAAKDAAVKREEYRLAADTLRREARAIATSWIECGKQIDAPEANDLYERATAFLKSNPQQIAFLPFVKVNGQASAPCLVYERGKTQTVKDEVDWQLGWLCLCLAVSDWSQDLCQCPRCKDFYVMKRDTQGANPGCCHECRRPHAESENTSKKRDAKHHKVIKAVKAEIAKLAKYPVSERLADWRSSVASIVSQELKLRKPITQRSITRWLEAEEISAPWSVTSCKGTGKPRLPTIRARQYRAV
jgi:hypothetical protein